MAPLRLASRPSLCAVCVYSGEQYENKRKIEKEATTAFGTVNAVLERAGVLDTGADCSILAVTLSLRILFACLFSYRSRLYVAFSVPRALFSVLPYVARFFTGLSYETCRAMLR